MDVDSTSKGRPHLPAVINRFGGTRSVLAFLVVTLVGGLAGETLGREGGARDGGGFAGVVAAMTSVTWLVIAATLRAEGAPWRVAMGRALAFPLVLALVSIALHAYF